MSRHALHDPSHQRAAAPLHRLIVVIFGMLAAACIGGGIVATFWKAVSTTEIRLLGAQVTTGHVGVAFVALGLLIAYFTVRAVLQNQRDLAALPPGGRKAD